MNRQELFDAHADLTRDALSLMRLKNRDYGENDDPFRNFRRWGLLGILVRLGDKLARLETFVQTGTLAVQSENVHDCVLDIINYAVLFEGYHVDSRRGRTGDSEIAGSTRPADQELISRIAHSRAGDAGGDSRGARRGTIAAFQHESSQRFIKSQDRAGSSSSGRRPVGGKSGRGKGKK